jgi:hypothetical protein
MVKYGLVRKTKKGNWKPCWLCGDDGHADHGVTNSDKAFVQRQRDNIANLFPSNIYALLEVRED